MAVTIISKPLAFEINTISNGFLFTVTSDQLAQENFRYTFRILVDGVEIGTKKVPSTGTNTTVDLQETVRFYIEQTTKQQNGTSDIWDITEMEVNDQNPSVINCEVFIGDQYELNGVIIPSELPDEQYWLTRGLGSGFDFSFASRYRDTVTSQNQGIILKAIRGVPMFTSYQAGTFDVSIDMTINWKTYDMAGTETGSGQVLKSFTPTTSGKQYIVYIPVGTDHGMFPIADTDYRVTYGVSSAALNHEDIIVDVRIQDQCLDNPITLMWKNEYFQWSQMTFDGQNSSSKSRTRQRWESQLDGTREINVIGRENLTLNTRMISDSESAEIQDLFLSDEVYIIPSGERVVIEQNSINQKTQQKDQAYNYEFRIQKSARLFRP